MTLPTFSFKYDFPANTKLCSFGLCICGTNTEVFTKVRDYEQAYLDERSLVADDLKLIIRENLIKYFLLNLKESFN